MVNKEDLLASIAGIDSSADIASNASIADAAGTTGNASIADNADIAGSQQDRDARTSIQVYCTTAQKEQFEYAARLMGDTLSSAGRRAMEDYINKAFLQGQKIFNDYGKKRKTTEK